MSIWLQNCTSVGEMLDHLGELIWFVLLANSAAQSDQ